MRKTNLGLLFLLTWVALALSGCGLSRKLAIGAMEPILDATLTTAYESGDVQTIREAIPGNLLLLRGLCESEPGNEEIRTTAVQLYFSYAQGFIEAEDPDRAVLLYQEGVALGLEGLVRKKWFREADSGRPLPDSTALARMERDDVPLVLWTMANWTGLIGLRQEEPRVIAQLPRVQAYLDEALKLWPEYFDGLGHVMLGTVWSFRPAMLGGDPVKGKAHFDAAMDISGGRMLFFQVAYAQYYCAQTLDEECFDQALAGVLDAPDDLYPEYRMLNLVAKQKARSLLSRRDEIF